ncbi:methylated-DNA--[protein]-cysteine S-methyltransferase [Rufibacter sp. LB8]|uniref:methylated-DNA--[protein]-cysteine S-methyltransferase n=1 Tax=Rufibacter sp. LB8 TaxID=2777781 RepID=UPI00178C50EB|nr:methylated-DNA--[protein]-cysteine S-methyltransferase [Rufibacter sp. LB8]
MAPAISRFTHFLDSPLGTVQLTGTQEFLFSCSFTEMEPETETDPAPQALLQAATQLNEYFAGIRLTFDLPLQPQGTAFQQQVWHALQEIPAGRTDHYLNLAKRMGNAKAVRAVGVANGANPWLLVVPCHRIIGASGDLVGYAGGLWRKKWLLDHEAKLAGVYQTSLF